MKNRIKILLLHQNDLVREKVTEYLRENDFSLIIAQNQENALTLTQSMKPDVVLWGQSLTTSAKAVIQKMKGLNGAANLPVFALVNDVSLYDRIDLEKIGINEILPFSPPMSELKLRIRFHLDNKAKLDRYQRENRHLKEVTELQYNLIRLQDVPRMCELVEEYLIKYYKSDSLITLIFNRKTARFDFSNIFVRDVRSLQSESQIFDFKTWNRLFFQNSSDEPQQIVQPRQLEFLKNIGLKSRFYLRLPVQAKDSLLGFIVVGYNDSTDMPPEFVREIDILASSLGYRISQIRTLFSGMVRPREDTTQIRYFYQRLNEDEIADYLCQQLLINLKGDASIYLNYNEGFRFLYPQYCYLPDQEKNLFEDDKPPVLMLKDYPTLEAYFQDRMRSAFYDLTVTEYQDMAKLSQLAGRKFSSALVFDVVIGNEITGLFVVSVKERLKRFTSGEIRQAIQMIQKAANALVESRVVRQAQKTIKQLDRIFELGKELTIKNEAEQLLETISSSIRRTLGWNVVLLDKVNIYDGRCRNVCRLGIEEENYQSLQTGYGNRMYSVLKDKSFSVSTSYFYDHRFAGKGKNDLITHQFIRSLGKEWNDEDWILIPIRSRGQELGCIMVNDPVDRLRPTVEKVKSLEYFANQAAVVLENEQLYQNLKSSEFKYRLLAETMTMGLVTCDFDGNIEYANHSFSAFLQQESPETVVGKNIYDFCNAASKETLQKDVMTLRKNDQKDSPALVALKQEGTELELQALTDETVPVKMYMTDYFRHDQRVGFLGVLADIRPQRRIERLKADFNSMIVHDLRSPLNIIQGYIDIVRTQVVGKISDEQGELLLIAKENVDKVLKLIDNFLTASKLEAGKFSIKKEVNSLNALIEAIYEHHLVLARKKDITLRFDLDPRISIMEFDKMRIEQVITNYVSNAMKFTDPKGEVVISTQLAEEQDEITEEMRNVVKVAVSDTGVGIASEELEKVFSKYEQTEAGKDASLKGTGLGLAICKEIISLHQGRVWVTSELGKGSTFYFSLPYQPVKI